jgi:hypothetical protein
MRGQIVLNVVYCCLKKSSWNIFSLSTHTMFCYGQGVISALEPGAQEIIKTQRKSLLELPVLALQEELLSDFPVNKKEVG